MSVSSYLQKATFGEISAPGVIPDPIILPIQRRPKQPANEFEATLAAQRFCVYVMRPMPLSAYQGSSQLFFDRFEIRCRVIEIPAMHTLPVDAFDVADAIAGCLHWKMWDRLAHPLQIAPRPYETVEDKTRVLVDVIFHASLQL